MTDTGLFFCFFYSYADERKKTLFFSKSVIYGVFWQ